MNHLVLPFRTNFEALSLLTLVIENFKKRLSGWKNIKFPLTYHKVSLVYKGYIKFQAGNGIEFIDVTLNIVLGLNLTP